MAILKIRNKNGEIVELPAIKGTNGLTPHIGENDHWFIGDEDTGIKAKGVSGICISEDEEMPEDCDVQIIPNGEDPEFVTSVNGMTGDVVLELGNSNNTNPHMKSFTINTEYAGIKPNVLYQINGCYGPLETEIIIRDNIFNKMTFTTLRDSSGSGISNYRYVLERAPGDGYNNEEQDWLKYANDKQGIKFFSNKNGGGNAYLENDLRCPPYYFMLTENEDGYIPSFLLTFNYVSILYYIPDSNPLDSITTPYVEQPLLNVENLLEVPLIIPG